MTVNSKGFKYTFKAKPWKYTGPNGWIFVSLPVNMSNEIRSNFKNEEEGWGRLKALAQIRNTEWKTAIWFDSKSKTYLLPLIAEVRTREKILINKFVSVVVYL
jgi:hypothetical protein